jgi:hypothetical protein
MAVARDCLGCVHSVMVRKLGPVDEEQGSQVGKSGSSSSSSSTEVWLLGVRKDVRVHHSTLHLL